MSAKVYSAQLVGLDAHLIEVEVDISKGLHSFSIVGLGDKAVSEAKDRISAALKNSGFENPQKGNRKVIISLAPADLKKEGSVFDLPIALATLIAQKEIIFNPLGKLFLGELSLDGQIRPIKGALPIAKKAQESGFSEIYLPAENAKEASLVHGLSIYPCHHLRDLVVHLYPSWAQKAKEKTGNKIKFSPLSTQSPFDPIEIYHPSTDFDFQDIYGQETAKRGLMIAAAGGHNLAMYGPPGTGKTMLARAFASILPPLSRDDIIETTSIHSAAGLVGENLITRPPLRLPHHTASYVSLVGGGAFPKPGEITLAHRGVLFLDEFPEFDKRVIESLRQPLEDRVITISRSKGSITFPANFILIATMNPCPCGFRGSRQRECICPPGVLQKYERKMSGPIVDRIDLWLEVPAISTKELATGAKSGDGSEKIREKVLSARRLQNNRYAQHSKKIKTNSDLSAKDLKQFAPLSPKVEKLLTDSADRLRLSARAFHRVIKLARTIADLDSADQIEEKHILEALQYRPKQIFS